MIDERHEELASLYALDLLAGEERAQFEAALASFAGRERRFGLTREQAEQKLREANRA